MAYVVSLKQFEGPLDLLLHLINQAKVDIKDIFVSEITEQYLQSMELIDELDMDTASEFLVMASLLLEIKSRALLPKPPAAVDPDEETPEEQLIRRLKEYQAFKESAGQMKSFEAVALNLFAKLPEEYPLPPPQIELTGLDMNGLMRAIRRIIARRSRTEDPGRVIRSITRERYTISQCVYNLQSQLRKGPVLFSDLLSEQTTRDEVITYFMALLEMLREGKLHVRQERVYEDILILPWEEGDCA
ncbi:MAG: segregation/condensation protein A [Clostridia bacterium]|nr:segregation/condensation protein A [Clostridia bacterium]